jgi:methylphosphotriester-DNA--protein-cysteine methyltransferase
VIAHSTANSTIRWGTTGVYCRPSCAARRAKRENVGFHATRADGEKAGFRPCKRCKPDQPSLIEQHAAKVTAVCRLIASAGENPTLEELARAAGLSPHHFHSVPSRLAERRRAVGLSLGFVEHQRTLLERRGVDGGLVRW